MKGLFITLFMTICLTYSCDTTKSSVAQNAQTDKITYTSPVVHTIKEAIKALPPDSIPTSYSIKGIAMAPQEFAPMMGSWVADYDHKEIVQFSPGRYSSYYDGEKVVEEKMVYYQVCPDNCEGAVELGKPCFVLSSDYGQTCFAILKHTEQELELTMLGGGDVSLMYRKE